jgi:hypothetical protein
VFFARVFSINVCKNVRSEDRVRAFQPFLAFQPWGLSTHRHSLGVSCSLGVSYWICCSWRFCRGRLFSSVRGCALPSPWGSCTRALEEPPVLPGPREEVNVAGCCCEDPYFRENMSRCVGFFGVYFYFVKILRFILRKKVQSEDRKSFSAILGAGSKPGAGGFSP